MKLTTTSKFDLIVFDEMQNCYFYDRFYEFMDLILKKGLTSGKYCFLGDFKYQGLVTEGSTIKKETLETGITYPDQLQFSSDGNYLAIVALPEEQYLTKSKLNTFAQLYVVELSR